MKKSKKIILGISIIFILYFIATPSILVNKSYAAVNIGEAVQAIMDVAGGILLYPMQLMILGVALAIQFALSGVITISTFFTGVGNGAVEDTTLKWLGFEEIIFYNVDAEWGALNFLSVDFFGVTDKPAAFLDLTTRISILYVYFRNIAIAALLVVLVYVAIRMILASTGEAKSKYKVMLKDWTVALCLCFLIHYIMAAIVHFNDSIVTLLYGIKGIIASTDSKILIGTLAENPMAKLMGACMIPGITGFLYSVAYLILVIFIIRYFIIYVNRLITMVFLTVMGPLLAIMYPIEKIHGGNAKAFNTWLKDYIFNVITQIFDVIIYIVVIDLALALMFDAPLLGLCLIFSTFSLRKWIGKVFGLDQASTIGNAGAAIGVAMGAMALGGAVGGKLAKFGGKALAKKNPEFGKKLNALTDSKLMSILANFNPIALASGKSSVEFAKKAAKGGKASSFWHFMSRATDRKNMALPVGAIALAIAAGNKDDGKLADIAKSAAGGAKAVGLDGADIAAITSQAFARMGSYDARKYYDNNSEESKMVRECIIRVNQENMTDMQKADLNVVLTAVASGQEVPRHIDNPASNNIFNAVQAVRQSFIAQGANDVEANAMTAAIFNKQREIANDPTKGGNPGNDNLKALKLPDAVNPVG